MVQETKSGPGVVTITVQKSALGAAVTAMLMQVSRLVREGDTYYATRAIVIAWELARDGGLEEEKQMVAECAHQFGLKEHVALMIAVGA